MNSDKQTIEEDLQAAYYEVSKLLERNELMLREVERLKEVLHKTTLELSTTSLMVSKLIGWAHTYGEALCPVGADTFGNGVMRSKKQVLNILSGQDGEE